MFAVIKTIKHSQQRYPTAGDWFTINDDLEEWKARATDYILVSELDDKKMEFLLAIHEFIEAYLCKFSDISQKTVDDFDMNHSGYQEPGDEIDAPYRRQHCIATGIERLLAAELDIPWDKYEYAIDTLFLEKTHDRTNRGTADTQDDLPTPSTGSET